MCESLTPLSQYANAVIVKMVCGSGRELGGKKRISCGGKEFSYCHWKKKIEFGKSKEEEKSEEEEEEGDFWREKE